MMTDVERKVRVRTAISEEQQAILKDHYNVNPRPSREEFRAIASRLMLDQRVVQVWFQNNRSRERKMNSYGLIKPHFPGQSPESASNSSTPVHHRNTGPSNGEQPLDLTVKARDLSPAHSPKYGMAPVQQQSSNAEEVMNLSFKSAPNSNPFRQFHSMYALPNGGAMMRHTPSPNEAGPHGSPYGLPPNLGLVPMDRLLQMSPELARNPLMGLKAVEPGMDHHGMHRSWKDEHEARMSHHEGLLENLFHKQKHMQNFQQMHQSLAMHGMPNHVKRPKQVEEPQDGQFLCDQCDKAFNKQSSLARHKYEHSGEWTDSVIRILLLILHHILELSFNRCYLLFLSPPPSQVNVRTSAWSVPRRSSTSTT